MAGAKGNKGQRQELGSEGNPRTGGTGLRQPLQLQGERSGSSGRLDTRLKRAWKHFGRADAQLSPTCSSRRKNPGQRPAVAKYRRVKNVCYGKEMCLDPIYMYISLLIMSIFVQSEKIVEGGLVGLFKD